MPADLIRLKTEPLRSLAVPDSPHVVIGGAKLGLGGVRTHLVLLCRLLLKKNINVDLFANGSNWSKDLVDDLRQRGARIHLPPERFCGTPLLGMLYAMSYWPWQIPRQADSLYCIGPGRSHLWLHRLKPRGVLSVNHEIIDGPPPASVSGRCAARLDVTIANSRKVAQDIRKSWPHKPVRVIPFLTSDRPMPAPSRSSRPRGDLLRVSYLGRLVEHKRPQELVLRWKTLSALPALGSASLDVYGYDPTGEMLERLRAYVEASGLADQIRIHGAYELNQLTGILAETDLVVLPSLEEGLPLVLVEAMSRGVPVVATAAGGTAELGEGNPDVIVTGTDWAGFESGLLEMACRLRAGLIDPVRLHQWTEQRYGCAAVSRDWLQCLVDPRGFFGLLTGRT